MKECWYPVGIENEECWYPVGMSRGLLRNAGTPYEGMLVPSRNVETPMKECWYPLEMLRGLLGNAGTL